MLSQQHSGAEVVLRWSQHAAKGVGCQLPLIYPLVANKYALIAIA